MKKLTYSGTTIAALTALVFAPALSYAQVEVNSETEGFLNASTDLVATDTEAMVNVDTNVEVDTEAETSTSIEDVDIATNTELALVLNAKGVAVVSPSQVNNSTDLEVFAENTIIREEQVKDINFETTGETRSKVEVIYKHQGQLLGVVPVTLQSKTTVERVDNELEVDAKLSWWGFLVTDKNRIENEIATRVRDNATIMMTTEYETTASAQAEIAAAIVTELNSYSSLQVSNNN